MPAPLPPAPPPRAVAALSSTLSTAALDKHPQSRERGITLDLGFSAFPAPLPPHLAHLPYDSLQFTLVDCPGHASLIRTIIGGARAARRAAGRGQRPPTRPRAAHRHVLQLHSITTLQRALLHHIRVCAPEPVRRQARQVAPCGRLMI